MIGVNSRDKIFWCVRLIFLFIYWDKALCLEISLCYWWIWNGWEIINSYGIIWIFHRRYSWWLDAEIRKGGDGAAIASRRTAACRTIVRLAILEYKGFHEGKALYGLGNLQKRRDRQIFVIELRIGKWIGGFSAYCKTSEHSTLKTSKVVVQENLVDTATVLLS